MTVDDVCHVEEVDGNMCRWCKFNVGEIDVNDVDNVEEEDDNDDDDDVDVEKIV